mmetsp:Transcript_15149/g.49281  ORF Transcript_15149/g.49281 Transcript_15149/m.49281 type:complete len:285 (+) Transcript_15149:3-857(+)
MTLTRELVEAKDEAKDEAMTLTRELVEAKDEAKDEAMTLTRELTEARIGEIRHANEIAALKHSLDVATGRLDARGLIESCVEDLWKKSGTTKSEFKPDLRLKTLLSTNNKVCKGLVEYMKLTAEENDIPQIEILGQGERLYNLLSARLHTTGTESDDEFPAAMFESFGRATMAAFAAFARASGRDVKLYDSTGSRIKIISRVPPDNLCDVTRDTLLKRPFLDGAPLPSLRSSDDADASSLLPRSSLPRLRRRRRHEAQRVTFSRRRRPSSSPKNKLLCVPLSPP